MAPQILIEDDFRQGLDLANSWAITRFPPRFSADDGIVSGLGRYATTGQAHCAVADASMDGAIDGST